jgi:hypothetical protein
MTWPRTVVLVNLLVERRSPPISIVLNLRSTLAARQ